MYWLDEEFVELAPELHETIWSHWWAFRLLPTDMCAAFEHACKLLQTHYLSSGRPWATYNQEKRMLLARAMELVNAERQG